MDDLAELGSHATGLGAALGGGLLIGLERERRKRGAERGPGRPPAGIRSFALAALGGGLAQTLDNPLLVALGAGGVGLLAAIAYWASRRPGPAGAPPSDPGLTTELALLVTYLVGVLAVQHPALGAGTAVLVAGLLASRERLHRFAAQVLSDAEWHDALILAALVLVLVPLAPATPLPWLAGLAPRSLLALMALILALQAAGHVALRLLGARAGLASLGLLSGFVSSTATIASMGARARAEPALARACAAAAVLSTAATWVQAMLLLGATAPAAAAAMAPAAATGGTVAALSGWWLLRGDAQRPNDGMSSRAGPLRVREALVVSLLLAAVAAAAAWALAHFGTTGLLAGAAIGGMADAHAPVAALGALGGSGQIDTAAVRNGSLLAVAANACTRCVAGVIAGGRGYGARVAASLALSTTAAAAVAALTG